jgi:hypothetical protein
LPYPVQSFSWCGSILKFQAPYRFSKTHFKRKMFFRNIHFAWFSLKNVISIQIWRK